MAQYIDKSALVAEIETYISNYKGILNKVDKSSDDWVHSTLMLDSKIDVLQHIISFIDAIEVKEVKEEPVSNDLEETSKQYALNNSPWDDCWPEVQDAFKAGAQWQKQQDQSTIELAEDHAMLAGQDKAITKACEWLENYFKGVSSGTVYLEDFKKAIKE